MAQRTLGLPCWLPASCALGFLEELTLCHLSGRSGTTQRVSHANNTRIWALPPTHATAKLLIYPSSHQPIFSSIHPSLHQPVHPPILSFIHSSIHLYTNLPVHPCYCPAAFHPTHLVIQPGNRLLSSTRHLCTHQFLQQTFIIKYYSFIHSFIKQHIENLISHLFIYLFSNEHLLFTYSLNSDEAAAIYSLTQRTHHRSVSQQTSEHLLCTYARACSDHLRSRDD